MTTFIITDYTGRGEPEIVTVVEANNEAEAIEIFVSHNPFFDVEDFEDGEEITIAETQVLKAKA
jgi:hypothetical protein